MTISLVLEAEHLVRRGIARATVAQSTGDPRKYSILLDELGKLDRNGTVRFINTFVNRKRARAVFFTPRTHEVESAPNSDFRTEEIDEETPSKEVDADTLAGIRAGIGAKALYTKTLANGLQVIYDPRPGMPLVTAHLRLFEAVAGADDLGAAYGASLVAQMPGGFFGNEHPGGAILQRKFDETSISYTVTVFSNDVNTVMASLAQHTNRFSVRTNAWEAFRRERVPFHQILERKPQAVAERQFLESLFIGSKFGRKFTTAQLENTTAERVQGWLNETHSPGNAALVIVGDFDHATMDRLVDGYFGTWIGSPKQFPPVQAVSPGNAQESEPKLIVQHRPDATQAEISFGCLLPPAHQKATDTRHDLGAALLENRLVTILREKAGIAYGVHVVGLVRRGGTAYFRVDGVVDGSKLVYSLSTIKKALADFAQMPIDKQELRRMQLRLARKHSIRYMSNSSIAEALGSFQAIGFPVVTIDDYGAFLGQVTADDIQADFKACLAGKPTFSIVGNGPAIEAAFKDVWNPPTASAGPALIPSTSVGASQKAEN